MKIGVVISTYNNPQWLQKTLWGYIVQSRPADEIIIADDGSDENTDKIIKEFDSLLPIRHIWHEDKGFRKTKILNEALKAATAEYIIFTDQDCVPRWDFIAVHEKFIREGTFLSGGYFKLPMDISRKITYEDITLGKIFSYFWLRQQGLKWSFKCTKLVQYPSFSKFMNVVTPTKATWNGMNASGWRSDLFKVNGFDERMEYGGEDREMGERLCNMGVSSRQIRYSAIVLHLDHKRPYVNEDAIYKNQTIRKLTRKNHIIVTPFGINKE